MQKNRSLEAEIISIGTELLLGHTVNTNATDIAQELSVLGMNLRHIQTVGDNPVRLREALERAFSRSDLVITTGGIGPTDDDMTKTIVSDVTRHPLVLHEEALRALEKRVPPDLMTDLQKRQAFYPKDALLFPNPYGTALGCALEAESGKWICLLPGPPRELRPMMQSSLIPFIQSHFLHASIVSRCVRVFGIPEASIAETLHDIVCGTNPTAATYAGNGEVYVRVTAKEENVSKANSLIDPCVEEIQKRLGSCVYGIDVPSLEACVVSLLRKKKQRLATAESCTGGLIAKRITDQPGSSEVFGFGFVTYANEAKMELLGVSGDLLAEKGAVSQEVALAMASGARIHGHADYGLAVTGIAGPDGGTKEKPVGLVHLALATPKQSYSLCLMPHPYYSTRDRIRQRSANHALDMLRRALTNVRVDEKTPI